MMISPAGGDPYAAAAALDRQLRSPSSSIDPSDSGASPDASPDVVVTLGQGASSSSATYGPPGRFSGRPSLEDMGANASDSLVHATESSDDDSSSNATSASSASPTADDGSADASVDEEAAVAT